MPTVTIADKVLANAMKPTQKGWTRQALSKDVGEGKAKFVKNALQKLEQEEKIEVTSGEGSGTRWRIIPHARIVRPCPRTSHPHRAHSSTSPASWCLPEPVSFRFCPPLPGPTSSAQAGQ